MTLRQQWAAVGGTVVVLGIVLGAIVFGLRDQVFPVDVGTHAPQFSARLLPSGSVKGVALDGHTVTLVNVWATWCAPCRAEMPDIEKLYEGYGTRGLRIVSVSIDTGISDAAVLSFAHALGLKFDILRDTTHSIERSYQITGYPESFVIDDVGVIRKKWIGAYAWNSHESRSLISNLLGLGTPLFIKDSEPHGSGPGTGAGHPR